jgi:tRNA threonylcarbamoyladenosine biosynthesis protein TsaB
VRIAVAVAQGVAFGAGLPTLGVSTLAALAQGEHRRSGQRRVLAALDARMGEVYWGAYELGETGLMVPLGDERVVPPGEVPLPQGEGWQGAGSGWAAHGEVLARRLGGRLLGASPRAICEAQDIAALAAARAGTGEPVAAELAQPLYLRDRVAEKGRGAPG